MTRQETIDTIDRFISQEVSLEDVSEELSYREHAAAGMQWDDSFYEYSTEELQAVEILWEEYNKKGRN